MDEINAQLVLDGLSGDTDYDVALPATFGIPDLVGAGVIQPLTSFAQMHEPPGFRDEILFTIGDTFDGEIYGFQCDGDTYVMFYNSLMMEDPAEQAAYSDRFGRALDVPSTWAELDQQMAFFHRPDHNTFGGALFRTPSYLAWEWWARFHSKGTWPFSEDFQPQLVSDAGISALEEMIRATEHLHPSVHSAGLFDNWQHYAKGNIYANIGWGGSQKYLNRADSKMRGNMRFGMLPCGGANPDLPGMPYFNWGWNYVVTTASKQPMVAYLFSLFASTSEMSTLSVQQRAGFLDPFRSEHYEDPVIQDIYSPEFLEVHEKSLKSSIPDLYIAKQGEYFGVLSEALDSALSGRTKPEDALKRVEVQWDILSLRAGREEQMFRWRELRAKYPDAARRSLQDLS